MGVPHMPKLATSPSGPLGVVVSSSIEAGGCARMLSPPLSALAAAAPSSSESGPCMVRPPRAVPCCMLCGATISPLARGSSGARVKIAPRAPLARA
eukprot:2186274-Prymnesium_polylepis.1